MTTPPARPLTVVSLHAHPDDEVLLTGGTLAGLSGRGHRVALVVATRGGAGLAGVLDGSGERLAQRRTEELSRSAATLGCARVVWLGYADSGVDGADPHPDAFCRTREEEAARRLAAVLVEEAADVLTGYDARGGYGHPDHLQVHRVARRAASIAGTPSLIEATVPEEPLRIALALLNLVGHRAGRLPIAGGRVFTPRREITHTVRLDDVSFARKLRALRAHRSQTRSPDGFRVIAWLLRLPRPVLRLALGREWFVELRT